MTNITSEKIDEIVDNALLEVNETSIENFCINFDQYKQAFQSCFTFPEDNTLLYTVSADFASFKAARDDCVEILRKSLKELLCEK